MSRCPLVSLTIGTVLLFLTIFTWLMFPTFMNSKIEEQLQLRNGSETFEKWRNITIPIYIKFYFFNVTNPNDIIRGKMPILQEIGPFTYQETRLKKIENIDLENDTVTYRQAINYYFRPELSFNNTDDVTLTVLNIPLVSVAKKTSTPGFEGNFITSEVNDFFARTKDQSDKAIFIQRTVRQMLFEGYEVPLLKHLGELKGEPLIPNNTFGLYYPKNGTFGTEHIVLSGRTSATQFGKVVNWEGQSELKWWNTEYCNKINGSDGSVFPPFITKNSVLPIFSEDFCRSSYLTYQKDIEFLDVPGYRFTMPKSMWISGEENPENECFCQLGSDSEVECNRNGTFSLSACRKGAPVVASTPYFLHGNYEDQSMYNFTPDPEAHETFIDIEPTTGMVLQGRKMFQVNIELTPTKRVLGFKKLPNILLPIVWGEEHATTTPERAADLRFKLISLVKMVNIVKYCLLIVSVSLIMHGLIMIVKNRNASAKANLK